MMKSKKIEASTPDIVDAEVIEIGPAPPAIGSRFSFLPILNRFRELQIDSFRNVVEAETELLGAMAEHASARQRLLDLPLELEAETLARKKRLQDARRLVSLGDAEDKVAGLQFEVRIAELEKRLKELKRSPDDEIRLEFEEEYREAELRDEYERRHLRRKIKKACQKRITLLEVFEEVYFDYFGNRQPEELDALEAERFRKLKNMFYSVAEGL